MLMTVLSVTFACMMLYATAGARIQGLLRWPRFRSVFQRTLGGILVCFGAGLALDRK